MKKTVKRLSVAVLCVMILIMSVVPAFADVTYVENHSKIDCASYYIDGSHYRYLIKIPIGTPLSAITVKSAYADSDTGVNMSEFTVDSDSGVVYQYTDATSDCYLLSYDISDPGTPRYMWSYHGIKLYYDYNGSHYMATNTANGSTTEGSGYKLVR